MVGTKSFSTELRDDVTIVRFVDTSYFDTDKYAQLQQELAEFVARERPKILLVDLSDVQYCSTAFISALLAAQNSLQSWAGDMKLFGLSQVVLETLQRLSLVGSVLSVYADEEAAKQACA